MSSIITTSEPLTTGTSRSSSPASTRHTHTQVSFSAGRTHSQLTSSAPLFSPAPSQLSSAPPSLDHSSPSLSESSIPTDLASALSAPYALSEEDGIPVAPSSTTSSLPSGPVYECALWFLPCSYESTSETEWSTHCLSHFLGNSPPRRIQCPLCPFEYSSSDGFRSWEVRMAHVARHHREGETLEGSRPDFALIHYLWQRRVIGDAQLQDLKGNYFMVPRLDGFTVTQGRRRDERRERRGRGRVAMGVVQTA